MYFLLPFAILAKRVLSSFMSCRPDSTFFLATESSSLLLEVLFYDSPGTTSCASAFPSSSLNARIVITN